jgi:hypothetical protein
MVKIFLGLREWFEQDGSHALTGHIAVGSLPKAFTVAKTRDKLALRKHQVFVGMNRDIDPSCDGQFTIPVPYALTGQMDSCERGRAHGVYCQTWSVKVAEVGDPVSNR